MSINLLGFTKEFKNKKILQNIDFTIPNGLFRLNGKNGVGKSTLLKIIAGLDTSYSGKIIPTHSSTLYLSVDPIGIHPFTIKENLEILWHTFDINPTDKQKDMIEKFFDYNIDASYSKLSTGMKAKIGLSLLFVKEWEIIIIDETLSSLDEESANIISQQLIELAQLNKTTILYVSHSAINTDLINKSKEILIEKEQLIWKKNQN